MLSIFSYFCNRQSKNSFFGQKLKISRFFKQSKDSYFSLNKKLNLTNVWNFFTKDISSALFLLHSIVVFTFCRKTAPSRLSLRLSTMLVFSCFDSASLSLFSIWNLLRVFATIFLILSTKASFHHLKRKIEVISSKKTNSVHLAYKRCRLA